MVKLGGQGELAGRTACLVPPDQARALFDGSFRHIIKVSILTLYSALARRCRRRRPFLLGRAGEDYVAGFCSRVVFLPGLKVEKDTPSSLPFEEEKGEPKEGKSRGFCVSLSLSLFLSSAFPSREFPGHPVLGFTEETELPG